MGVKEMDRPAAVEEEHEGGGEHGGASSAHDAHEAHEDHEPAVDHSIGPSGPVNHHAASKAFAHLGDTPAVKRAVTRTKVRIPPPPTPGKRLDLAKSPKLPPAKPFTPEEQKKYSPDQLRGLENKSPEEQAAAMSKYKRSQMMSPQQQKETEGMTDEQAQKHLFEKERQKYVPQRLKKNWMKMSDAERDKALKDTEVVERAIAPIKQATDAYWRNEKKKK